MDAAVAVVWIDGPLHDDLAGVVRLDQVREHRPIDVFTVRIESLQVPVRLCLTENWICCEGRGTKPDAHERRQ